MKKPTTSAGLVPAAIVDEAWQAVGASFEQYCLTAGLATLAAMMDEDAAEFCGPRYGRADGKDGHRWGKTMSCGRSRCSRGGRLARRGALALAGAETPMFAAVVEGL